MLLQLKGGNTMNMKRIDEKKWPAAHAFTSMGVPKDRIKGYGLPVKMNSGQRESMAKIIAKRMDDLYDELENRFISNDVAYDYLENEIQSYMVEFLATIAKDFDYLTDF
jgi:hypothetical protein